MYALIVAESPMPDEPTRDIYYGLKELQVPVRYLPVQRLSVRLAGGRATVETRRGPVEAFAVVIRGLGYVLDASTLMRRVTAMKILEDQGVVSINPVEALMASRNKLASAYLLQRAGVPVPATVATEDLYYGYAAARELGSVVVKPIQGSRGFGAMLFTDPDQAFQVMRSLLIARAPLYIQKYVEKPNRDIRVIVVDGRAIGCMYRVAAGWKTNIAQGASGLPCRLTQELEDLAVRATRALGLVYSGVDIGEGKDGYVVFEVNASPDWRGFRAATGVNPGIHLAEYVRRLYRS